MVSPTMRAEDTVTAGLVGTDSRAYPCQSSRSNHRPKKPPKEREAALVLSDSLNPCSARILTGCKPCWVWSWKVERQRRLSLCWSRRRGVFHPDNFTFGQTVYLSPLYAAAQAVPGVESVRITTFQRQGTPDPKPLADGKIELHRLEIARLDHDPNFPERGVFRLTLGGGK